MLFGPPYFEQGFIRIHFTRHLNIWLDLGCQCHKCIHMCIHILMGLYCIFAVTLFGLLFPLVFPWDGCTMGFHTIDLLCFPVKLDILTLLIFPTVTGFFVFVGALCVRLLGVLIDWFTLLLGLSGAIQRACFITGQMITWMSWIIFLALSRVALIRIAWRGVLSHLTFPVITDMVWICPSSNFRSC